MAEPPDPLNSPDPLDEPMLEAVERSIEQPPDLQDPLAEIEDHLLDPLARQLDALEASIENTLSLPADVITNEQVLPDAQPSAVPYDPAETRPDQPVDHGYPQEAAQEAHGSFETPTPPLPEDSGSRLTPPNPPEPRRPVRGGGVRRRRTITPYRHRLSSRRPVIIPVHRRLRFCPETHKVIDKKQCESCDKYRHWPEGTHQEPRTCWYDWQAKAEFNKDGDDGPSLEE